MSLPETWIETTVGQVILNLQPGFAQRPGEEGMGTVPQIRTHNVSPDGKLTTEGIKHVKPSEQELSKYKLMVGDVIFNNTNSEEWVGKTAVFDVEGDYVFSNHMTRLRVNSTRVNPDFLATYLHMLWAQGYSRTRAKRWVSQAAIDSRALTSFKLPLPTLPEQEKIVDILQKAQIVAGQRDDSYLKSNMLMERAFVELFGDPEPKLHKRWPVVQLGTHVTVETGGTPSREKATNYVGQIGWVKSTELKDKIIWRTEEHISENALNYSNAKVFPPGTILLAMYGQGQTRGRTAKLAIPAACNQACAALLPSQDFEQDYLWCWLQLSYEKVRKLGRGGQQENLNLSIVRGLHIPKPPIGLQKQFSVFLDSINECRRHIDDSLTKFKELNSTLIMTAIRGDLTKRWREEHIESLRQESTQERRKHGVGKAFEVNVSILRQARTYRELKLHDAQRDWLLEQLSEFQNNVRWALYEWKGTLISDDPEMLDDFCRKWPVENEENLQDQIRRVLNQLASMGLIAKISLRSQDDEGKIRFLTGYRFLRDEERTQTSDVSRLEMLLTEAVE